MRTTTGTRGTYGRSFPGLGVGLALGVAGAVGLVLGWVADPRQASGSYLTAYAFAVSLAIGSLGFLMVAHAAGATWIAAVRRPLEAAAATLPLLALLFVPVALGREHVYPWVHGAADLPAPKQTWLAPSFFLARSGVYLAIFAAAGALLWRFSTRAGDGGKRRVLCIAGLPVVGLAATFASFDWLMSLDPHFASTAYGLYVIAGAFAGALALGALATVGLRRRGLLPDGVGPAHDHALGKLLFTFVVFWAYVAFAQGLIVWIADRPEEARFFATRLHGGWRTVLVVLAVAGFAVPFLALLPRATKRRPGALAAVAAVVLATRYVDVYWLVKPALDADGPRLHWLDGAALAAVLGFALAAAAWRLRGEGTAPFDDPALPAALRYRS